ncbi:hypothetical protein PS718_01688 [Pseudomonas fluorescens]|uniref:Uncharacterized protein n=2 Tax=Pseudomonas fluorescens TaxID=294 RepID=A0A5E7BVD2_PSEFL|nr:hypothetical protein PS718_01688 [Pseudomonas fluorescens]
MQSNIERALENVNNIIQGYSIDPAITEIHRATLFVRAALNEMIAMPSVFDDSCEFNIKHIGSKFTDTLQGLGVKDVGAIERLFSMCYRLVIELELKSNSSMSVELNSALSEVEGLNFIEHKIISEQLKYAKNRMTIHMMRDYIKHPHMISLKELPAAIKASEDARAKVNEELDLREQRVNALNDKLKGYENAYNFVGLYQGFSNLRNNKDGEKAVTFKFMIVLGVCLVVVPLLKVVGLIGHSEDLAKELFSLAALLALELMLIYFFRITLQNFRSIKSQMLQIDLRMTLCQFINSYVEFASDARKTDKELLSRFEQVIFSGIVAEDSLIPSTFDGLEQVAKIVDSLKPK